MKFIKSLNNSAQFHYTGILHKNYPGFTVLSQDPFVGYIDTDITDEDIDYVLKKDAEWLEFFDNAAGPFVIYPNVIFDLADVSLNDDTLATGSNLQSRFNIKNTNRASGGVKFMSPFIHVHNDEVELRIRNMVCDLVRQPITHLENTIVGTYTKDKSFGPHYDSIDYYTHPKLSYCLPGSGGARTCTALLYANDDFEGGSTTFPYLGISIKPKKGRLVLWHNVGENAMMPAPGSWHTGEKILSGTKKIFTFWFRLTEIDNEAGYIFWQQHKDATGEKLKNALIEFKENINICTQTVLFKD